MPGGPETSHRAILGSPKYGAGTISSEMFRIIMKRDMPATLREEEYMYLETKLCLGTFLRDDVHNIYA